MRNALGPTSLPRVLALGLSALAACGGALEGPAEEEAAGRAAASIPAGYYDSAEGKTDGALLAALEARIRGQRSLGYNGARDRLFSTIADPDGDDRVSCIYTGRTASGVRDRGTAYSKDLNTEHTWPQSLGATGDGKADLHHLFVTDEATNGRRGNYAFGEVATTTWTAPDYDGGDRSRLGRNSDGRTVFEPQDEHKGDIARALLYFYTRYRGQGPSLSNFRLEEPLLRQWHAADPPDAAERERNDAIYKDQQNRNPYIDHPEYVERITRFAP